MNTNKMNWFRQAKYGMFIHWGLYALPGGYWQGQKAPFGTEWIMRNLKIPLADYRKLADQFNPVEFNAEQWVQDAKDCGMKYIVFTAKHHDGFAMYDSRISHYNIVEATPFKRDILAELSEACRKLDVVLCLYYSQYQDWEDPDANGNSWDFPDESAKMFRKYFDHKAKPQVRELLENYGKIGLIWFDTPYEMPKEYCQELVDLVREIQPDCLINGRVGYGLGDYRQMGDNGIPVCSYPGDWETPMTLNDTWGYSKTDENWKSTDTVMKMLIDVCQRGGNFLINIGPNENGTFPTGSLQVLEPVGEWMRFNGESIYGVWCAPDFPYQLFWGGMTYKEKTLYLHIMKWPVFPYELCLVGLISHVKKAYFLHDNTLVHTTQTYETARDEYRLKVQLPEKPCHPYDTVVVLKFDEEPIIKNL